MKAQRVAHLRPVPHDQRLSARDEARQVIEVELARIKAGSKEHVTSCRLLSAVKALHGEEHDPVVFTKAAKVLNDRLGRLKTVKKQLDACQKRDLKIILFFSTGERSSEARQEACAILKLYGDDVSVAEVCRVYPGLRKAFEEV